MYSSNILLVRADASGLIGGGHIMRCLALADAWVKNGGNATFVSAEISKEFVELIEKHGHKFEKILAVRGANNDILLTFSLYKELNAVAVVLDGYCFTSAYQKTMHNFGLFVIVYDDLGSSEKFFCNILVNQNIHADSIYYNLLVKGATLLTGSRYASIRDEYLAFRNTSKKYSSVTNVVISLGLSDTTKIIEDILRCLSKIEQKLCINIVVGQGNIDSVQRVANSTRHQISCSKMTEDFSEVLSKADLAIISSGGTAHEAASIGVPMIVVCIAKNQQPAYKEFVSREIALGGGMSDSFDCSIFFKEVMKAIEYKKVRVQLGINGMKYVDGKGAERVALQIMKSAFEFKQDN